MVSTIDKQQIRDYFTGKINFTDAIDTGLVKEMVGTKRKNLQDLSDEKQIEKKFKPGEKMDLE